jgi:hypothetical protein
VKKAYFPGGGTLAQVKLMEPVTLPWARVTPVESVSRYRPVQP